MRLRRRLEGRTDVVEVGSDSGVPCDDMSLLIGRSGDYLWQAPAGPLSISDQDL